MLLAAEFLWLSKRVQQAEVSRKFVHILAGVFIASWPFFIPFWVIQILSLLMLAGVFVSKKLQVFKSIHAVERPTYGEYLFPVGVLLAATFARSDWVYVAALLHLSLADGFAALFGTRSLKKRRGYKMFGQSKTLIGSLAFYVTSVLITAAVVAFEVPAYDAVAVGLVIWLPLNATVVENFAVYGTDNVLIPALIVAVLNSLRAAG